MRGRQFQVDHCRRLQRFCRLVRRLLVAVGLKWPLVGRALLSTTTSFPFSAFVAVSGYPARENRGSYECGRGSKAVALWALPL